MKNKQFGQIWLDAGNELNVFINKLKEKLNHVDNLIQVQGNEEKQAVRQSMTIQLARKTKSNQINVTNDKEKCFNSYIVQA